MSALSAFASLIADGEAVRHPERSAEQVASTVATQVSEMRQRVAATKARADGEARQRAAVRRRQERAKRTPAWLAEIHTQNAVLATATAPVAPAAPTSSAARWRADDEQHLAKLLRDDALCKCRSAPVEDYAHGRQRKRARADAAGRGLATCCCFARLIAISKALQRPFPAVQQRLQSAASASAAPPVCFQRAQPLLEPDAPQPTLNAAQIAASWASFVPDPLLHALPSTLQWQLGVGHVLAVPPAPEAIAEQWDERKMHELVMRVRERRAKRALEQQQQPNPTPADPADGSAAAATDDDAEQPVELQTRDWEHVAASLIPPAHPESARMAYERYLDRGGATVPESLQTPSSSAQSLQDDEAEGEEAGPAHAPFYFPSPRARYQREERVVFCGREDEADSDDSDEGEDSEGADGSGSGSERAHSDDDDDDDEDVSIGEVATTRAPSSEEVLRAVRRLSKRYRA